MANQTDSGGSNAAMLFISWVVVGVPLIWGVYNTLLKLPALFR